MIDDCYREIIKSAGVAMLVSTGDGGHLHR